MILDNNWFWGYEPRSYVGLGFRLYAASPAQMQLHNTFTGLSASIRQLLGRIKLYWAVITQPVKFIDPEK
jgi:hypothetical protein